MAIKWEKAKAEERIRHLMAIQGMTEAELAKKAGLSQSTVHRIIAGRSRSHLTVARLEAIGPVLGVTPSQLLDPDMPRPDAL